MAVSGDEVDKLAELSRLKLSESEQEELSGDLGEILEFAEKIKEVDTEDVPPTYHAQPIENVMRPDEQRTSPDPEPVLERAPARSEDYFVVPRVIEE
ncbi:MAG: Asp-tRNA(Asn)/Glu-tRNA(Gln) amidotransferase subunit GatC [bacterium]